MAKAPLCCSRQFLLDVMPRPESEILLRCASAVLYQGTENNASLCDLLATDLDWALVLRMARQHRLIPLVNQVLSKLCPERVPSNVLEAVRVESLGISLNNLSFARETVRVTGILEAAGVPVIVFKGPALAVVAYGEVGLRQFSDVDILVHPADLPEAAALLSKDGYLPTFFGKPGAEGIGARAYEDQFVKPGQFYSLDVHWHLTPQYLPCVSEDAAWKRAMRLSLDAGSILSLSHQDLVLFLCVHAAKHGWPELQAVCDVAAVIQSGRVDWSAIVAEASESHSLRMLQLGLYLAHDLLGTELPGDVLAAASASKPVSTVARRIARKLVSTGSQSSIVDDAVVQIWMTDGFQRRFRLVVERGLQPTVVDWQFVKLPRSLFFLYYVLRPIRIAARALGQAFRNLVRRWA
jgi:hypothetical protein